MTLDPRLLEVLVCPQDKGPLLYFDDENILYNDRLRRRYEVRDGNIPVLLVDKAADVNEDDHERLLKKARVSSDD